MPTELVRKALSLRWAPGILPQANLRTPDYAKHKENRRSFSHSETMRTRTYSYLRRLRTSKPSRTRGLLTSADKCLDSLALVYRRDPLPREWSATPQSLFPGAPCERSRPAANVTRAEQQRASLTATRRQPTLRLGRFAGQGEKGVGFPLSLPQWASAALGRFHVSELRACGKGL